MKVAFIYPECENLGVEYLSACLKKAGHSVELIFDPLLFKTYFVNSRFLNSFFDFKEIVVEKVAKSNPQLICFSVFSDYYGWACERAAAIKKITSAPIVFGGMHPTCAPRQVMANDFVDYVCVGEGEAALIELAEALSENKKPYNVANIWLKEGGIIHENPVRTLQDPLDELPFPDKELFRKECPGGNFAVYTIITGRGCVHACTYCYNSFTAKLYKHKGNYLRRRSAENVLAELRAAKEKGGINRISFFDDLFIHDFGWLRAFLPKYKDEIGLPFFCHVHPLFVTREVVEILEACGCSCVTMGIQTFNPEIRRKFLHRYETNAHITNAVNLFKKTRIFLFTNIILGLPGQDEGIMADDVWYSTKHKPDMVAGNWLRYYPATEIINLSLKENLISAAAVEKIYSDHAYLPYSARGNTFNIIGAKLRNLLTLSRIIPFGLMRIVLRFKLYRVMPSLNLRFVAAAFIFLHRKIFLKKRNPFSYISMADVLKFYIFYMWGKIKFKTAAWAKKRPWS